MHAVTRLVRAALIAALVVGLLPAAGAAAKAKETTYEAPYKQGPEGSGAGGFTYGNPDDGRVFIGRMYPVFNPISCGPGGGFSKLQVKHGVKKKGKFSTVSVDFTDAAIDPYTFVTVAVKNKKGDWLASGRQRGPIVGSGTLETEVFGKLPKKGKVTILFGLEMASACPQLNGGSARFTQVTVK